MFFDTIMREAFKALLRNKVRSVLTMLGIIAGVGSFICVVGVGEAGSKRVEDQLHNVGDNLVWLEAGGRARNGVRVGSRGSKTLTLGDFRPCSIRCLESRAAPLTWTATSRLSPAARTGEPSFAA